MVRPTHYTVAYEINPWMDRRRPPDTAAAARQWEGLYRVLTEAMSARVSLLEPAPGLPDMVFTANAGLIYGDRAVVSNFRYRERQGEAPLFRRWFEEQGLRTEQLPSDISFEGEGDALFLGDTLFAGYRWRSDARAHTLLSEKFGVRVLSLELVDAYYYHLDTCFCPLDAGTAAYYPAAFDEYARKVLAVNVPDLIAVEEAEAARFACNAVVLGRHVALNTGCPRFAAALRERGFAPHPTCLDEFLKAGGSAKCLTLYLDSMARVPKAAAPGEEPEKRRAGRPVSAA